MSELSAMAQSVYSRINAGSTGAGIVARAETVDDKLELLGELYIDAREWRAEESQIIDEVKREVRRLTEHVVSLYQHIAEPEQTPGESFNASVRAAYGRKAGTL